MWRHVDDPANPFRSLIDGITIALDFLNPLHDNLSRQFDQGGIKPQRLKRFVPPVWIDDFSFRAHYCMKKRSQCEGRKKPALLAPEASVFESGRDPDDETADNFGLITANLVIECFRSDDRELNKAVIAINDSSGRNVINQRLVGSPFFAKLPYGDYSVKLHCGHRAINRTITIFPRAQLRLATSWSHETIIPAKTKTDSLPSAPEQRLK